MGLEFRTTQRLRQNEQLDKTRGKKADGEAPKSQLASVRQQTAADKLALSAQALSWLEQQQQKRLEMDLEQQQRRQARMNDSLSALDSSKKELDDMSKKLKILSKCQKIAASIMRGDRVPPEDLEYLMNNDPEGYKLAMAMRREKKDPEDCESVLDEEDRSGKSAESAEGAEGAQSGGGEVSAAPSAAPSEGGGDASAGAE